MKYHNKYNLFLILKIILISIFFHSNSINNKKIKSNNEKIKKTIFIHDILDIQSFRFESNSNNTNNSTNTTSNNTGVITIQNIIGIPQIIINNNNTADHLDVDNLRNFLIGNKTNYKTTLDLLNDSLNEHITIYNLENSKNLNLNLTSINPEVKMTTNVVNKVNKNNTIDLFNSLERRLDQDDEESFFVKLK